MRNFRELKVWQAAIEIVKEVYLISNFLPSDEKFGLRSQITRAAVSVPSNIAEGSAKSSEREFKYYLEMALGSLFELETQLILIDELNLVNGQYDFVSLKSKVNDLQKMLNSFIGVVKARPSTQNLKPKI